MLTGTLTDHVAGEEFVDYMVVFGSERHPNVPEHSHTFAAFLRSAPGTGSAPGEGEPLCISWLPQTRVIRPLWLLPETGWNFGLIETIDWALMPDSEDPGAKTYLYAWGPFRILPLFRDQAAARIAELKSGRVEYVVEDLLYRPHRATNCIHALSDLGLTNLFASHSRFPWSGSELEGRFIILGPWIMNPSQTYKEVRKLFGLPALRAQIQYVDYKADGVLEFVQPQHTAVPAL